MGGRKFRLSKHRKNEERKRTHRSPTPIHKDKHLLDVCSDESRPPLLVSVTSLDSGSNIPQCTPDKHPFSLMCSNVLHEPCAPLQLEVTSLDRYGDLASQVPVEFLSNTPLSTPDKNESTGSLMCSDVLPESRPPQLEVISLGKYSDLHSLVPIEFGSNTPPCTPIRLTGSKNQLSISYSDNQTPPPLLISLPISHFCDSTVQTSTDLVSRLKINAIPLLPSWIIASESPFTLGKVKVNYQQAPSIIIGITIGCDLLWHITFLSNTLTSMQCPLIGQCPVQLNSIAAVHNVIRLLDSSKICVGNSDNYLVSQFWMMM